MSLLDLGYEVLRSKNGVAVSFVRPGEHGYTESIHFEGSDFRKIKHQGWEITDMVLTEEEHEACLKHAELTKKGAH